MKALLFAVIFLLSTFMMADATGCNNNCTVTATVQGSRVSYHFSGSTCRLTQVVFDTSLTCPVSTANNNNNNNNNNNGGNNNNNNNNNGGNNNNNNNNNNQNQTSANNNNNNNNAGGANNNNNNNNNNNGSSNNNNNNNNGVMSRVVIGRFSSCGRTTPDNGANCSCQKSTSNAGACAEFEIFDPFFENNSFLRVNIRTGCTVTLDYGTPIRLTLGTTTAIFKSDSVCAECSIPAVTCA
jgi:hypothetical protein